MTGRAGGGEQCLPVLFSFAVRWITSQTLVVSVRKKIMKISFLPLIFPLAYTVAALALLSVGAHKTATHAEAYTFMDRGFDYFNHKFNQ